MTAVPQEISPEQREMLTPVQEVYNIYSLFLCIIYLQLLLYIMKRDSNVIPALFVATEINNMTRQGSLMFSVSYTFYFVYKSMNIKRVMETCTHTENTFRPLAELSYVTGRLC